MASMNSGIILAGQQPNFLNTIATANQAAAQQNQFQQQNALRDFNRENGAAVLAGDQNALNQYAGIAGPEAALGIQGKQQAMQINQEELGMRRETAKRQAIAWGQTQDDRTKAETAQKIKRGLMSAGAAFEAKDEAAFNRILQENGVDPFPMAEFPYKAAEYEGVLDGLTAASQFGKPPETKWMITDTGQAINEGDPLAGARDIPNYQKETPTAQSPEGKLQSDIDNGILDSLSLPSKIDFETEQKLRKEFLGIPAVKAFSEQAQAFGRIVNSAKDPSPAGDLALIFNFMKVLDPGSVVRESEFATAAQADAWLQQSEELGVNVPQPIAAAIRKMASGQRLSPLQRQDFVGRAEGLYSGAESAFVNLKGQYEEKAKAYNLDPNRSLADFRYQAETPVPPAAPNPSADIAVTPEQRALIDKYSKP